jgi:hypothetical protein
MCPEKSRVTKPVSPLKGEPEDSYNESRRSACNQGQQREHEEIAASVCISGFGFDVQHGETPLLPEDDGDQCQNSE